MKKIGEHLNYEEYLKTDWWNNIIPKIHKRDNGTCQGCYAKEDLEVHHKKYRGWYKEKLSDLILLCRDCHEYQHSWLRKFHIILAYILSAILVSAITFAILK